MSARPSRARAEAFEIDGGVAPVKVLRLKTNDPARIEAELRARMAAVAQPFPYAPVVVDVADLDAASAQELPLQDLAERLRACQLLPVGAANLPPTAVWNAAAAGIGVVELVVAPPPAPLRAVEAPPVDPPPPPAAPPPTMRATLTVRQPVRSGQRIYAEGGDLVVMAPVNAGAELIADGHIHVYGPLRGHARAGARGMRDACIFCQSLEAELVAIADHHLVADEIPSAQRGAPTQVWLDEDRLRLRRLC